MVILLLCVCLAQETEGEPELVQLLEEAQETNDKIDEILQALAEQNAEDAKAIEDAGIKLEKTECGCLLTDEECLIEEKHAEHVEKE